MYRQARYDEPLVRELGKKGRIGCAIDVEDEIDLPESIRRKDLSFPELSELEVVRHYTHLSQMNFGVDSGMYPLGSCTMKYNPKVNEEAYRLFKDSHPYARESQGSLELMYRLEKALCEIGGVDAVTLQPPAGAAGEFTGMSIVRAYFDGSGRTEVLVPDSAHGTNPASAAMAGFKVVEIPSGEDGCVDVEALRAAVSDKTACFMMTNPNTLGIFESRIKEITQIVHGAGALLYYDGANLNGIMGKVKPGAMGFDIMHFNLHKTFSTPHGSGGPGAGPVGVKKFLEGYLPVPRIREKDGRYILDYTSDKTIGKVQEFYGNFGVLVRAFSYILLMGKEGLEEVSAMSTLNSNYMKEKLRSHYTLPYAGLRKHEFVLDAGPKGANYIAKRLLDYGIHAPTVHFPLIVKEAFMIEPTESETRETLDRFIEILIEIGRAEEREAPLNTSVSEVDVVGATKKPVVTWRDLKSTG
jgi:glycine dehydrogenase subunit 2